MKVIQSTGSVDDIRGSLRLMNPVSASGIADDIRYLNNSLHYEVQHKNRSSLIKMLQSKIRALGKLKPGAGNVY